MKEGSLFYATRQFVISGQTLSLQYVKENKTLEMCVCDYLGLWNFVWSLDEWSNWSTAIYTDFKQKTTLKYGSVDEELQGILRVDQMLNTYVPFYRNICKYLKMNKYQIPKEALTI